MNGLKLGNCAEIEAVSEALSDGSRLEDIRILVIDATRTGFGKLKPSCENCDYTLLNKWRIDLRRINVTYSGTYDEWEWGYVRKRPTKKNSK